MHWTSQQKADDNAREFQNPRDNQDLAADKDFGDNKDSEDHNCNFWEPKNRNNDCPFEHHEHGEAASAGRLSKTNDNGEINDQIDNSETGNNNC